MPAPYVELYMDQGSDFKYTLYLTDDITNSNVNVASYNVFSDIRRSYYSANTSAKLICEITDETNGEITISLPAANTANLKAGKYVFDLKVQNSNNIISRILEGVITVTPSVTR